MSLPLQSHKQPTSSPSKSSLRRPSGADGSSGRNASLNSASPGPTTHFASEATQHHFLPHSPPNQNLDYEDDDQEDAVTYDEEASYQTAQQPQIPFQPFFALIEDTLTNEHYHPTVHYIFADDEPDIITEAACRSLDQNSDGSDTATTTEHPTFQDQSQDQSATELAEPRLPPARPDVKEHYLILDVQPSSSIAGPASHHLQHQQFSDRLPSPSPSSIETAQALARTYPYTVTSTQSLSADWQILRTRIIDAPTISSEQDHDPDEQHLMLRIEGRGNSPDKLLQRKDGETMEDLIERFQTRLAEIRHLMVDLNADRDQQQAAEEEEGDMFTQGGLVGIGFQPTGFGNAVLDEQD